MPEMQDTPADLERMFKYPLTEAELATCTYLATHLLNWRWKNSSLGWRWADEHGHGYFSCWLLSPTASTEILDLMRQRGWIWDGAIRDDRYWLVFHLDGKDGMVIARGSSQCHDWSLAVAQAAEAALRDAEQMGVNWRGTYVFPRDHNLSRRYLDGGSRDG